MKIADLRIQTSVPDAPTVGVVGLYANASGVPVTINSAGVITRVGENVLTTYSNTNIVTGGAAYLQTGVVFTSATSGPVTGLGQPSTWLNFTVSGITYAVPAYSLR